MSAPRPKDRDPGRPNKDGIVMPVFKAVSTMVVGGVAEVQIAGQSSIIVWFINKAILGS